MSLTRIGTAAYTDRWINTIRIETGTSVSSTGEDERRGIELDVKNV